MSLILDALDKSDRERADSEAVPGLQTLHQPAPLSWRGRNWLPLWLALGLVLLLVAAGGVALYLSGDDGSKISREAGERPASASTQTPTPTADTSVAELYARTIAGGTENRRPGSAAPPPESLNVGTIVQAAQQALSQPQPPVEEHRLPLVSALAQRDKDAIPTILFSAHYWSSTAAERSVVLNDKPRREGDTIAPGLTLLEILEDSIVLDYRDTGFRLRALNSWVNL